MDSMEQVIEGGSERPVYDPRGKTFKRMFYFDSAGLYRKQLKTMGKDALIGEISGLVKMAKKAGANFTEIHEAAIKAYGLRAVKREMKVPTE